MTTLLSPAPHAASAATPPIKLHFGCGPRILKGFINFDRAFEPYEAYLQYYGDTHYPAAIRGTRADLIEGDFTQAPLPFADNSVDVVYHEDFLEHISQRDQILFLAETLRVLKPGGVHRVNTPNLASSMRDYSNFALGHKGVYIAEWDKHVHLSVLTPLMLREFATIVGYSEVHFTARNASRAKAHLPLEYRPDPRDRPEDGNIFADLIK